MNLYRLAMADWEAGLRSKVKITATAKTVKQKHQGEEGTESDSESDGGA